MVMTEGVCRRAARRLGWFLVVALTASAAWADGGWSKEDSGQDMTLYSRDMADSGIDTLKIEATLAYSPDEVAGILNDISQLGTYMPAIKSTRIVSEKKRADGHVIYVLYQVNNVPVVTDRDVVLLTDTWSVGEGASKVWHSTFKAVSDRGPKATDDYVRITRLNGGWTLTPMEGGKSSRFVYTMHAEVGGNVPDFMVQNGQEDSLMEMVSGLKKRCAKIYGAR